MSLLWQPTPAQIAASNMTALMRRVGQPDYASLYRWSVDEPDAFWRALWQFCDVLSSGHWTQALDDRGGMLGAKWFDGARLNYTENLLRHRGDRQAIVAWNESGFQRALSFDDLYGDVARLVDALRGMGVRPGDRVAAFATNIPETIIAMLAAASLGAIWSSCSPDFGLSGVLDRFGQIEPKVMFAIDGYTYNGKPFDTLGRVKEIRDKLPSVEKLIVIPSLNHRPDLGGLKDALLWPDLLAGSTAREIASEHFPFDHPLYILYSSGTTGPPKCIVHRAGGILVQHLKEHVLHCDLSPTDRIFWFTTCGWMMWNWLVSGLATGATLVLYDGSPVAPDANILFDLAERERLTHFGTSAKYISAIEKAGLEPRHTHNLPHLKAVLSTGSPLLAEGFDYVYEKIKADVQLSSISGGTDLCGCLAIGNPILPVYRGEIQCRPLGLKTLVYDDDGRPVFGQKGELVCAAPFPSMPLEFWNDPGDVKYRQTYFERFPGVWCHGDYAEITEHDGLIIYGRSDAVLNPGGVRIGTAEIYRQVEQLPEVLESLVIGQDWQGDVRVVLFVKLHAGSTLDDALIAKIKDQIRRNTTPRHVPAKILQVADIPRTKSGKIVELAVRNLIHGRPVKNIEALANPEALEHFRNRSELNS
jgi:acetoacetyl-CoA synthetase